MTAIDSKAKRGKCLALFAVLAVAFVVLAAVPAVDADATEPKEINDFDEFKAALANGGDYILIKDISDGALTSGITVSKNVSIDFNGKSVTISGDYSTEITNCTLELKSGTTSKGTFTYNGFTDSTKAALSVAENGSLILDNMKFQTDGSAILPYGNASDVTVKNSEVSANVYAISVNNSYAGTNALTIDVQNSILSVANTGNDNTAVLINALNVVLTIKDSVLKADRQTLFVRAGTATVTGTEINYTGNYTGKINGGSEKWGSGNEVTSAAVVVGDKHNDNAYPGVAKLTLIGGKINASKGNAIITSTDANTDCELNLGKTSATEIAIGDDVAEIKNLKISVPDFLITQGSVNIEGDFELGADGSITVTGNAVITGNVSLTDGATINVLTGATLTIASGNNVTVNGSSKITGNGTVTVNNGAKIEALAGSTVDVTSIVNNGTVLATPDANFKSEVQTGSGATTTTGGSSWSTITLTGGTIIDASTSITGSASQEIRITGDVTVTDGGNITVNGKLVIDEGATLTLKSGSKLIINGVATAQVEGEIIAEEGTSADETFQFKGSEMNVKGSVTLSGKDSFVSTGTVNISGSFEIADGASAVLDKTVIAEGGVLTIYGVATGTLTNNGTITVDSQGIDTSTKVNMTVTMGDKAVIDAINLTGTIKVDGIATITDVSGTTLTASVKTEDNATTTTVTVAGDVTVADNYDNSLNAGTITVSGNNVKVDGKLTLGTNVKMTVNGALSVSGEIIAVADSTASQIDGTGAITVTGTVTSVKELADTLTINAAVYKTTSPSNVIYTTLVSALTSGATVIELSGNNTVDSDITIPVGTTVKMKTGSKLTVAEDVTVTVDAADRKSGKLTTVENGVDVKGTLIVKDKPKSGITETHINSDTKKVSGDSITFTNIYNAIGSAVDGEVVEITRIGVLTLSKDLTIPAEVTLKVPTGKSLTVGNGVAVEVNGKVVVEGTYIIADKTADKAAGKTVVNGLFQYTGVASAYNGKIVGAYFTYDGKMTIAPLANVIGIASDIKSDVELYGDMKLDTIDFSAYDGEGTFKAVKVMNKLTFESFTIGKIKFEMGDGIVNGKIVTANGSIALVNVKGISVQDVISSESTVSNVTGTITSATDSTSKSIIVDGSFTFAITSNSIPMTVNAGSTVVVKSGLFTGDVSVDGTMKIASAGISFDKIVVLGTVASVGGNNATAAKMFIGLTEKDLGLTTGATAVVDGLKLNATVDNSVAYVSPDAEVKGFDSAEKTEYYYEDALYLTAYANDSNSVKITDIKITVKDAKFTGWNDSEGESVGNTAIIGEKTKVFADVKYDIYNIRVTVDSGIGSVAINGIVLENKTGNVYTISGLKAGTCKVTYVLKPNYEGTPELTVNGDKQTSLEFTLSGTPASNEISVDYTLSLVGTSPVNSTVIIDNGGDKNDGMGLTDILLIILVVLAAILVVVVAIRMMRS